MYRNKIDARKVDEISLENMYSIKAFLFSNGVKIVPSEETKTVYYPTKAVQYTRFYSKLFSESENEQERLEKEYANNAIKTLHKKIGKQPNENCKEYMWTFDISALNHGQRIAKKERITRKRIKDLYEERKTILGKIEKGLDIFAFRLGGSLGIYEILDGPFGDIEVYNGLKVRDVSLLGFAGSIGLFTIVSNKWRKHKEDIIWDELAMDKEIIYKQVIFDTLESFEQEFPNSVVRFRPKNREEIKKNGKLYKLKYAK